MLMIFDLLASPQGHQFDPRMKMLLAFCSAYQTPYMTMFEKKKKFDPWAPPVPQSPTPGA